MANNLRFIVQYITLKSKKTMKINWNTSLDPDVPASLQEWLLHKGSFMQRLKQFGISDAEITVLNEKWQTPWDSESQLLTLSQDEQALVREVLIFSKDKLWMFARTVFPRYILQGKYECLANLQNRALGSVLFKDPDLQRSEFEFVELQPHMPLYAKVAEAAPDVCRLQQDLWTRRSLFTLRNPSANQVGELKKDSLETMGDKSLLLTEVFLPDMIPIEIE